MSKCPDAECGQSFDLQTVQCLVSNPSHPLCSFDLTPISHTFSL